MNMIELVNYYIEVPKYNKYEIFESYRGYNKNNPLLNKLKEMAIEIENSDILTNEELAKDSSIRFSLIIDACDLEKTKDNHYKITKSILNKYKDIIMELSKDREITRNLTDTQKRVLREVKAFCDPLNNLNYVEFKDYNNTLSMIAFINGHISNDKKLTQAKAGKALNKVLLEDKYSHYDNLNIAKSKPVLLFCINNLMPYLNSASKRKLLKFILKYLDNPTKIFFDCIKKYPDDYISILFDKEFYIKKFNKFTDEEIDLFVEGLKDKDYALGLMLRKSQILANRLSLQPNSGAQKIILTELKYNPNNGKTPYLTDIIEVFNNIDYIIRSILIKLGYTSNDY